MPSILPSSSLIQVAPGADDGGEGAIGAGVAVGVPGDGSGGTLTLDGTGERGEPPQTKGAGTAFDMLAVIDDLIDASSGWTMCAIVASIFLRTGVRISETKCGMP